MLHIAQFECIMPLVYYIYERTLNMIEERKKERKKERKNRTKF